MPGEKVAWVDQDSMHRVGHNQLRPSKERELRAHVLICSKKIESCNDCWLLYRNIGTSAWNRHVSKPGGEWPKIQIRED